MSASNSCQGKLKLAGANCGDVFFSQRYGAPWEKLPYWEGWKARLILTAAGLCH